MNEITRLLEEFLRSKFNEQAVSTERVHFYKTDRRVDPRREAPFKYFKGTNKILVSAPHAVRHVRQKKIKKSDEFTGALAFLLNQVAGCHTLAVTKLYGGDPNWDFPCIYKNQLAEICQNNNIALVLDLHGAAREHIFDVDLGTNGGKSLLGREGITELLVKKLQLGGLNRVSRDYFAASGANTVTNYVSRELKIPALQLEINRQYRVPAQNPQGFCRLAAILAETIKDLDKIKSPG